MLDIDVDFSRHELSPSIDFDDNDSARFAIGPMESEERTSRLFNLKQKKERFSWSNLQTSGPPSEAGEEGDKDNLDEIREM